MVTKKRVLVPLAPGFEELEAIAVIDYLRRAGAHVVTASVDAPNPITGRNRVRVMADIDLPEALEEWGDEWDLVVLPGGPGVERLAESEVLRGLLARRLEAKALTGAICAAPRVLAAAGLAEDTLVTNHPGCRDDMDGFSRYTTDAVAVDGPVVTSRGPGTAVAFALALVEALYGADAAAALRVETVAS
ncbi:MAG: DJ-1/PfpI family protein [Deltaproteobacteria bacterium]|nr:MAG: DJ-1/PfpI family protein [Deltaproteobacteria bacterium]